MPTLSPGCHCVPRWRRMMLPASTRSPPNSLTPRRLPAESRPLREEPPAFLWAISKLRVFCCLAQDCDEITTDFGHICDCDHFFLAAGFLAGALGLVLAAGVFGGVALAAGLSSRAGGSLVC